MGSNDAIRPSGPKNCPYQQPADWFAARCLRISWLPVAFLVVTVFMMRLPAALIPRELNVDESLFLSQAMKFLVDPRPWIGADVTSSGPLNSYFLDIFLLLGFSPTFVLVHILANILISLQILLAYATVRTFARPGVSLFAAALVSLFYGLSTHPDYLHYAGELLPTTLLMLGFYLSLLWLKGRQLPRSGQGFLFTCGFVLGIPPWCKLQAAPVSAALCLLTIAAAWSGPRDAHFHKKPQLDAVVFVSGAALPTIAMVAALIWCGALRDFWYSYIINNAAFAGALSPGHMTENLVLAILRTPLHQLFLVGIVALVYAARRDAPPARSTVDNWAVVGSLVYFSSAAFAVCRVKHFFPHHVIFLVAPAAYAVSWLISEGCSPAKGSRDLSQKLIGAVIVVITCATVTLYAAYGLRYFEMLDIVRQLPEFQHLASVKTVNSWLNTHGLEHRFKSGQSVGSRLIGPSPWTIQGSNEMIAQQVRTIQERHMVKSLAIWGWQPGVYVLTSIPPATRYSDVDFVISPGPVQALFRSNFVSDMRKHPPDLFIDAVVPDAFPPWARWTDVDGYESDVELREFIRRYYLLTCTLSLEDGSKPVKFFVRSETTMNN